MAENSSDSNFQNLIVGALLGIAIAVTFAWYFLGGGVEQQVQSNMVQVERQAAETMDRIERQVANDAVKQYGITERNGSPIDAYVQAGIVAAAFLQAEDEANYRKWKKIEERQARRAGLQ